MRKEEQSGAVSRWLVLLLAVPVLLVGLLFASCSAFRHISERPRTSWKADALERLAEVSLTNSVITRELGMLNAIQGAGQHQYWAGENVLLMANGEFVVYEYRHGSNDYFPPHLFLGRSSDGRWLYSSFHFCRSMAMVNGTAPPESIAEFSERYAVREFDGQSDECLNLTHRRRASQAR